MRPHFDSAFLSFIDKTTATGGNAVYCSNTTDKWNDGTLLYSGPSLNTDIITFAVCKYLTYVPPLLIGSNMVELCEIEIGGKCFISYNVSIYLYNLNTFSKVCVYQKLLSTI